MLSNQLNCTATYGGDLDSSRCLVRETVDDRDDVSVGSSIERRKTDVMRGVRKRRRISAGCCATQPTDFVAEERTEALNVDQLAGFRLAAAQNLVHCLPQLAGT